MIKMPKMPFPTTKECLDLIRSLEESLSVKYTKDEKYIMVIELKYEEPEVPQIFSL